MLECNRIDVPKRNILKKPQPSSSRNICGGRIRAIRANAKPPITQDDLSGKLAALGISIGRVGITKIENGQRAVLDFELKAIAKALRVELTALIP